MAIEHDAIVDGERHEPKDISTAVANQVYIANGSGGGTWTNAGGGTNTKVINIKADLPTPVSGVISLVANTDYVLGADVSVGGDRLDVSAGNISWTSNNQFGNLLTYTGTGNLFTGVDVDFNIFDSHITCPSGTVFNMSDVAVKNAHISRISAVRIESCTAFGTFTDMQSPVIENSLSLATVQGITIAGTNIQLTAISRVAMLSTNAAFVGVDLGVSTSAGGEIENLLIVAPAGGIGIKGAASSANVLANGVITVRDCNFIGGMTAELSGLTSDDVRFAYSGNSGIADTRPDALIFLLNNTTNTVITTVNTPVVILGTYTEQAVSHFTTTAAGRITYTGEKPLTVPVVVTITAKTASGGDKDVTFYVAKNGSIIANSGISNNVKLSSKGNTGLSWQEPLVNGDFIEIFCENNIDAVDILVEDMSIILN